jgi:hypothetical protein
LCYIDEPWTFVYCTFIYVFSSLVHILLLLFVIV